MSLAFSILGCVAVLLFAVAVVARAFAHLIDRLAQSRRDRDWIVRRDARRDLGVELVSLHHWFSEDLATWHALRIIGESLQTTSDFNVSDSREKWRRELKVTKAERGAA